MDLTTPSGSGPFLAVVAVHGGGWSGGTRNDAGPFCRLVVESGFACAAIDYRLAPGVRFPEQIGDLRDAIGYLLKNAGSFGLFPKGVILAGESAGGHLVSYLGAEHPQDIPIVGVIAFSAPTNLVALSEPGRALSVVPPEVRDLLGITGWTAEDAGRMRDASPLFAIKPGMPPFLIIHGQSDRLIPPAQSREFCDEIRRTGGECDITLIAGARHGLWSEDQFNRWNGIWRTVVTAWSARQNTKMLFRMQ